MHIDGVFFKLKEMADAVASPFYTLRGRPPWSLGYYTRKKSCIEAAIDGAAVRMGQALPESFGIAIDERVVEYPWLFDQLRRGDSTLGRMLDAGSTLNHEFILDRDPLRKADLTIMTLAPEKRCYWYKGYSYVFGDFRNTEFKDASFDTIIEATGDAQALDTILHHSRAGATILLLGLPYARRDFNFESVVSYDKTIIGSVGSTAADFDQAIALLPEIDSGAFFECILPFAEFHQAWNTARSGKHLKVVLEINALVTR